jgi:hypothetical protein
MAEIATQFPGPYVYLDIAVESVSFTTYVNGSPNNITPGSMSNCSYNLLSPLLLEGTYINNITIYVSGPLMSARDVGSSDVDWSFQFNSFMYVFFLLPVARYQDSFFAYSIGQSTSATTTTSGQFTSAATRSNKPQTVMIFSSLASILLGVVFLA